MTLVGEEEELIVLLGADERVNQPRCVPKVHVFVYETVYQQK